MSILEIPNISPRRRRRMLREHQLRQDGYSLRQIAEELNVSVATVHADLRLLEENWALLEQDIHADLLLQQIARLDRRVERLSRIDPIERAYDLLAPEAQLSYDRIIQIEDRHERRLAAAERELRMLLKQLQNRHITWDTRSGDCPADELADPEPNTEPDRTNLNEPERVQLAIPSKTLEIAPPTTPEKNPPEHPKALPSPNGDPPQPWDPSPPPSGDPPLPRNTGHNHHPNSPPLGEAGPALDAGMSRSSLPRTRYGDRGGLPFTPPSAPEPERLSRI